MTQLLVPLAFAFGYLRDALGCLESKSPLSLKRRREIAADARLYLKQIETAQPHLIRAWIEGLSRGQLLTLTDFPDDMQKSLRKLVDSEESPHD